MKILIAAAIFLAIGSQALAQQNSAPREAAVSQNTTTEDAYVVIKNGKPMMIIDKVTVTIEKPTTVVDKVVVKDVAGNITLSDGSMITPEAVFVAPDGLTQQLHENDKVMVKTSEIVRAKE